MLIFNFVIVLSIENKTITYLNIVPIAIPPGRVVGKSFKECTTKSTLG